MTTAPGLRGGDLVVRIGERLSPVACLGMGITIAGIAWVIMERPRKGPARLRAVEARPGRRARGIALAVIGGFCQAAGLMLSKAGMGHGWLDESAHLDPQAATLVRMTFAGIGVIPLLLFWRIRLARSAKTERTGSPRAGFVFIVAGTVVGPVLGVWMSLVAADATSVGIAQTLLSLTPLFILPYAAFVEKEHISWRAALGAGWRSSASRCSSARRSGVAGPSGPRLSDLRFRSGRIPDPGLHQTKEQPPQVRIGRGEAPPAGALHVGDRRDVTRA